jgi:acetyl/propionyl-CoA carboxylase alpha subunit
MKLNAQIAGATSAVNLQRDGNRVHAEIDDRRYEIDVHEASGRGFLLISDGRVFECRLMDRPESGKRIDVLVGSNLHALTLTDPRRLRGTSQASGQGDAVIRILAPMAGKIVRVMVAVGEQIEAGAGVIVVEAMKMQNEMKAPRAGIVVSVTAEAGATVNAGDVLAVLE